MTLTQNQITNTRRLIVMVILALGGFGIGTTEFVSMGLLKFVAADFSITEETAGHMISVYAAGVVVGAPLVAVAGATIPRRLLLLILMAFFTIGNALCIIAPSYHLVLAARFIAGLPHGAYFSIAALVASAMAPAKERGRAIAFIGMGLPIACVIGVPAAQAMGGATSWQSAYAIVAIVGLLTFLGLFFFQPHMDQMRLVKPTDELGALKNSQVMLTLAIGAVGFGGMFAVYTYISWTMTAAGLAESSMWLVLMAYGIGMVCGNWVGGRLADKNLEYGIFGSLVMIVVTLLIYYTIGHHALPTTIAFGFVGFFGSCLIPSLQIRLMDRAGKAQTLAAALNQSALNIANAGGAAIGGMVIAAGHEYRATALAGAALAFTAIWIWLATYKLAGRSKHSKVNFVQDEALPAKVVN